MKYKCDQLLALAVVLQQKSPGGNEQQQDSRKSNRISKLNKAENGGLIAVALPHLFFHYSSEKNYWKTIPQSLSFLHPKDSIIEIGLNNTEIVFVCTSAKKTLVILYSDLESLSFIQNR